MENNQTLWCHLCWLEVVVGGFWRRREEGLARNDSICWLKSTIFLANSFDGRHYDGRMTPKTTVYNFPNQLWPQKKTMLYIPSEQ